MNTATSTIAKKQEEFEKLLGDLGQGAGSSRHVSVSDADADQIQRLGKALQATEHQVPVLRLEGGCFCQRGTNGTKSWICN